MGMGAVVGDTNVKIHLEVLEICDNEEAMDSVSIVSNISQSSAHTRSPSLRYSRRENRFVSCDLGETASYSLLIPSGGNPERENINISIPDTVEAHRQNSRRQMQDSTGYHEEIQMLNEAYRKSSADREEWERSIANGPPCHFLHFLLWGHFSDTDPGLGKHRVLMWLLESWPQWNVHGEEKCFWMFTFTKCLLLVFLKVLLAKKCCNCLPFPEIIKRSSLERKELMSLKLWDLPKVHSDQWSVLWRQFL